MITCILLAAGSSQRFGSPKALARLNEATVIENLQSRLIESNINNIIIVLGAHAQHIQPFVLKHKKVKVVYNKHHNFGQTSSFQCGLKNIDEETTAVLLLPVDFPLIKTETINLLIQTYKKQTPLILVPTCQERKGHPPVFSRSLEKEFLDLDISEGINTVAHRHSKDTRLLAVKDPGILASFNTPEEFHAIKKNQTAC